MIDIRKYIDDINQKGEKVLSVFLTAGLPSKASFVNLAIEVFNSGADIIEIGIPFSDPLADGPVIQEASQRALTAGITVEDAFTFAKEISSKVDKPIIAMTYANVILSYGTEKFLTEAAANGFSGVIIPDLVPEEYDSFLSNRPGNSPQVILLAAPTSSEKRIEMIDSLSEGFLYYVSVTGTTGVRKSFDPLIFERMKSIRGLIKNNKLLAGFGISTPADIKNFAPYCDGVIVGSAVVKRILSGEEDYLPNLLSYVKSLKKACGEPIDN